MARLMLDPHGPFRVQAYRMSLRNALLNKTKIESVLKSLNDELLNMGDTNKVMKPTMFKDIPKKYRDGIIPVHVFFKEKYKADGTYDKMKARLVANGDKMNPDLISNSESNNLYYDPDQHCSSSQAVYLSV